MWRNDGVGVSLIGNDGYPGGHNAPGTGVGAVDIHGHDDYLVLLPILYRLLARTR